MDADTRDVRRATHLHKATKPSALGFAGVPGDKESLAKSSPFWLTDASHSSDTGRLLSSSLAESIMFPSIAGNDLEPFKLMEMADSERVSEDWVTDPQQLADWQNQLVRFCEDINMQLSQIRQDLGGQTVRSLKVCALSNGNVDVSQDESRTISQA